MWSTRTRGWWPRTSERARTAADAGRCARCDCTLAAGRGFGVGAELRCLRCACLRPALLRQSFLTAAVVGTLLIAINQGNVILQGQFPASLYWKIPLTYSVPFLVTTWGALISSRR